ncbi:hypothetical protein [Chryseobacterium populi]|uniref:Sel1 repeat protein n=1 Tax=Chryseobacterium populi TaxID=1144316 RepID=J2KE81_9FLAO|nr:hypothetical protein [Chryseobacterium populi]EJL71478.1 hypothetical protein PMI13_02324 [Chryseobacterium populi]
MRNLIFLFLSVPCILACSDKNNAKNEINNNITDTVKVLKEGNPYLVNYENKERIKKLLDNAIKNGDTLAYQDAFKDFSTSGHLQEFLYYSVKMAKNHNYSGGYFDTYYILNLLNNQNGYLSIKDKNESLFYLLRAYEMGNSNAKYKIKDLFLKENKKIPTSESVLEK